ncbi:50S ribosomal protein L11 methyltransferase [Candidatus Solirubrobacter pratensis]|uniref:50S ribosomal protein L11 methyltransferase n=1 Tax=Candidatus Solirubrobacter pratensis TaxID=1298857 RepID=UPI0003FDCB3B|nr:50S ribosomal protein L11 methyltransferase [Candidatus Solirubrobacter pratensis]
MIRVAVRVAREHAEPVLAELLELVPGGLEEREVDPATVEYVLYGAEGELPALGSIRAAAGPALVDVSTSQVPDDWDERWRSFHTALDVGPVRVRPPWEPPRAGALDVVIDPGQAFGTGSHPTTRLVLELLTTLEPAGALADWGCGSGILAIAAAKLGWAPVLGCDHDPAAVEATIAGAAANEVEIAVSRCDLRREEGPHAPTVLANLVRPLLLDVAATLTRPPERLIASGLHPGEVGEVAAAFAGLREARRVERGGWAAVELVRV